MGLEDPPDDDEMAPLPPAQIAALYEMDATEKRDAKKVETIDDDDGPDNAAAVDGNDFGKKKFAKGPLSEPPGPARANQVLVPSQADNIRDLPATVPHPAPARVRPPPPSMLPRQSDSSTRTPMVHARLVEDDEPHSVPVYDAVAETLPWWKQHQRSITVVLLLVIVALVVTVTVTLPLRSGGSNPEPIPALVESPSPMPSLPVLASERDTNGPSVGSLSNPSQSPTMQQLVTSDGILSHTSNDNVAVYNDVAVVGAPENDDGRGSVFVFKRGSEGEWMQQTKLVDPDGAAEDRFGVSVGVYDETIVVGAPFDDDDGFNSGSVHVFEKSLDGEWVLQTKLLAPGGYMNNWFGNCVAIHGNNILVGADGGDESGVNSGSVHVFAREGTSWSHTARLLAPDGDDWDEFGSSVGIYERTVVVGAHYDGDKGKDSGAAHVFVQEKEKDTWVHQTKLVPANEATDAFFGHSVAIFGNTVIVGAHYEDVVAKDSGSAQVFVRNGTSWNHQATLSAPNGAAKDFFGVSVGIDEDVAIVGANVGNSAHVFVRNDGTWAHKTRLVSPGSAVAVGYGFGQSVDIHTGTAVVGTGGLRTDSGSSGAAYAFLVL